MAASALLWAVPATASVVALVLVLAWSRRLEDLTVELTHEVRALPRLREPLVTLRHELDQSAPLVERVHDHWEP